MHLSPSLTFSARSVSQVFPRATRSVAQSSSFEGREAVSGGCATRTGPLEGQPNVRQQVFDGAQEASNRMTLGSCA